MEQTLEGMKKKAREEFDECFPYIDGNNGFGELDHVKDFVDEIIEQVYNAVTEEVMAREKTLKDIHKVELDTVSCMSLEQFVLWSEQRKSTTKISNDN